MSGNPFRNGGDNPFDKPMINGQPIGGTRSAQDPNAVVYDSQTDSVNLAGQALIQSIMRQVDKRTLSADDIAGAMAEMISPMLKRITTLERQLDVRRDDTAAAIQQQIDSFMGDEPTLDDLNKMAADHKQRMKGLKR